jgi:transcriptional regulator with XRE-family HTH domain
MTKRVVHQKAKGPVDPVLGRRVRALREAAGLTQSALAGSDFSKGFISLVETGRTRMSLRAIEIIAKRLNVTTSELLEMAPLARLDGVSDLSARLEQLQRRCRDPRLGFELAQLAVEASRLAKRRLVSVEAVHQRVERAIAPLRELAEATA